MLRLSSLVVLLALLPAGAQQNNPHPAPAQFEAALETLNTSHVQWAKAINSVKAEELPVSYSEGKLIEDSKYVVNQNLRLVVTWVGRVEREHSLYAEVNLVLSVQELQDQMLQFAGMVSLANMPDRAAEKELQDWAKAVSDIATGPLGDLRTTTVGYVTDHAHLIDQTCATQAPTRNGQSPQQHEN